MQIEADKRKTNQSMTKLQRFGNCKAAVEAEGFEALARGDDVAVERNKAISRFIQTYYCIENLRRGYCWEQCAELGNQAELLYQISAKTWLKL